MIGKGKRERRKFFCKAHRTTVPLPPLIRPLLLLFPGYGHSTPKTYGGKLFTMMYAIVGIPLGLVMFNSIGERLNNLSSIVINRLRRLVKAKQLDTTEMDLMVVVSLLTIVVFAVGTAAFSHYEGERL